jgi:hypothetical protein
MPCVASFIFAAEFPLAGELMKIPMSIMPDYEINPFDCEIFVNVGRFANVDSRWSMALSRASRSASRVRESPRIVPAEPYPAQHAGICRV